MGHTQLRSRVHLKRNGEVTNNLHLHEVFATRWNSRQTRTDVKKIKPI